MPGVAVTNMSEPNALPVEQVSVVNCNVTSYNAVAILVENARCVCTPEPGVSDTVQAPE